jgi:hypothetical protein
LPILEVGTGGTDLHVVLRLERERMGGSHEAAGHKEVATGTVTHGHSENYDKNKLVFQCYGSVTFWYGSVSEDSVPLTNGIRVRNPRKVLSLRLKHPNVFQTLHVSYSPDRLGQVSM